MAGKLLVAVCIVAAALGTAATAVTAQTASAKSQTVMLVVDTSGSMEGTRLDQAKQALNASINALQPGQPAGLRSYAGDCGNQGVLRVAIGADNRDALRSAVSSLTAGGSTPTPDALRGAADNLAGVTGPKTIVLISDGESTCGDPCPVAQEIKNQQGIDFKVHTVGFQAPSSAEDELSCIAQATGGTYVSAVDEDGLATAISQAVSGSDCRDPLNFDLSTPQGIADLIRPDGGILLPIRDSNGAPICVRMSAVGVDNRLLLLTQVVQESKRNCETAKALAGVGAVASTVFYGAGYVLGGPALLESLLSMPGLGLEEAVITGMEYAELIEESCGLYERSKKELEDYLSQQTHTANRPTF